MISTSLAEVLGTAFPRALLRENKPWSPLLVVPLPQMSHRSRRRVTRRARHRWPRRVPANHGRRSPGHPVMVASRGQLGPIMPIAGRPFHHGSPWPRRRTLHRAVAGGVAVQAWAAQRRRVRASISSEHVLKAVVLGDRRTDGRAPVPERTRVASHASWTSTGAPSSRRKAPGPPRRTSPRRRDQPRDDGTRPRNPRIRRRRQAGRAAPVAGGPMPTDLCGWPRRRPPISGSGEARNKFLVGRDGRRCSSDGASGDRGARTVQPQDPRLLSPKPSEPPSTSLRYSAARLSSPSCSSMPMPTCWPS